MKVSAAVFILLAACAVTLAVEHAPTPAQKTTALNPVTDAKKGVALGQIRNKRFLGLGVLGLGAAALGAGLIGAKVGIVGGALAGGLAGSIASHGRSYSSYNSYPVYSSGCTYCDIYRPYPYAGGYGYFMK